MKVREIVERFPWDIKVNIYDDAEDAIIFHSYINEIYRCEEGQRGDLITPYDDCDVVYIRALAGAYLELIVASGGKGSLSEAVCEANRLIDEQGLTAAYATVKNRIIEEENKEPRYRNYAKIADDRMILREISENIIEGTMHQNGWTNDGSWKRKSEI